MTNIPWGSLDRMGLLCDGDKKFIMREHRHLPMFSDAIQPKGEPVR